MTNAQFKSSINRELKAEGSIRKIERVGQEGVHTVLQFADGVDIKTLKYLNNRFANGISIDETKPSLVYINTPDQTKVNID